MKRKYLIAILSIVASLPGAVIFGQNLPVNPATSLVSIRDSIQFPKESSFNFNDFLSGWSTYIGNKANLTKIYKLNPVNEAIAVSMFVGNSGTETEKNVFVFPCSLYYNQVKTNVNIENSVWENPTNGTVQFNFHCSLNGNKINYEFTDFEFFSVGQRGTGKFEEAKPTNIFSEGLLVKNNKIWRQVKQEYFERVTILAERFREFLYSSLGKEEGIKNENKIPPKEETKVKDEVKVEPKVATKPVLPPLFNYDLYKSIGLGMNYGDVVKLFGNEGKELNISSVVIGNKTVVQRTVIWYESETNKSKSITVSFSDDKVSGKSQTNL